MRPKLNLPTPYQLFQSIRSPTAKRWLYYGFLNAYLPHFGAGIRITHISADLLTIRTRMRLHWWNRNFIGTHFGGSLYAMCDAFFMLILFEAMGRDYVIWDKAASIRFRKPGRGPVTAEFHVPASRIAELREQLLGTDRCEATFRTEVRSADGQVIAEVEKVIHFRHKSPGAEQKKVT